MPGHEVIGTVVEVGGAAKKLKIGDRVGLGWISGSCMACKECLSGHQNICPHSEGTIVGRYGGFAERVRAHWAWAIPLPDSLTPPSSARCFAAASPCFSRL